MIILKIDHRDITVDALHPGYEDTAAGLYESAYSRILITPTASSAEQARLLLHEIIHALWDVRQIPGTVTEELACRLLDGALATVFRDNPHLLTVLGGALHSNEAIV